MLKSLFLSQLSVVGPARHGHTLYLLYGCDVTSRRAGSMLADQYNPVEQWPRWSTAHGQTGSPLTGDRPPPPHSAHNRYQQQLIF